MRRVEGRLDFRGTVLPAPEAVAIGQTSIGELRRLDGSIEIRGGRWRDVDFSLSNLPSLRLFDMQVVNCLFDNCDLPDLRMWGTKFSGVSFREACLKGASLGAVHQARRMVYDGVDFSRADLRGAHSQAAEFNDCLFHEARLDKVDFGGSNFVDCRFTGELREVLFYRRPFGMADGPENQMKRVDFSQARLRWCAFRGLDLDEVLLPQDDEHIVLRDYPLVLSALLERYENRSEPGWKRFCAVLADCQKWLGPSQTVGVINKADLLEMVGDDNVQAALAAIEAASWGARQTLH
jgi:uncharacterized protein YjbI with pentapeptide repeats